MKRVLFSLIFTLCVGCGSQSSTSQPDAFPRPPRGRLPDIQVIVKDLSPRGIMFSNTRNSLGNPIQRVRVLVQNIGNAEVGGYESQLLYLNRARVAFLYGVGSDGRLEQGTPIQPRAVGELIFDIPANSLQHCQKVPGQIDLKRDLQSGGAAVFANDSLAPFPAINSNEVRACIESVAHP